DLQIVKAHNPFVLGLDNRLLEGLARRPANVKRSHGELGAGFPDRLCGDDSHCLPELDGKSSRQIASVTFRANASFGFTGERRADLELLKSDFLQGRGGLLINDLAGLGDGSSRDRILDGLAACASNDARGE